MANLKLLEETVMIERNGKFLFLVPTKPDWIVTNSNGAYLLSLCDGSKTIEEIIEAAEQKSIRTVGVRSFFENLINKDFFKKKVQIVGSDYRPVLRSVHLNMHKDCNLECVYCYAEERTKEGLPLTKEEYMKLIDDLGDINQYLNIEFTGGEPLLNKNTIEIAEYAKSKGHTTRLLSNATPISEKNAARIALAFDHIRISLDGSSSEVNDPLRGEGTFKQITEAIRLLEKNKANVQVAMTVTKSNIHNIEEANLKFGSKLTFQPLFNAGSAKLTQELAITGSEYFQSLAESKKVNPMGGIAQSLERVRNRGVVKCAVGDAEISISHDGNVYPCHMLHLEEFAAGNVRENPIKDIYNNSDSLKKARGLHINAREECASCIIRLICGGACRARSLYLAGDINAADDFCDYEFSAYLNGLFQSALLEEVN